MVKYKTNLHNKTAEYFYKISYLCFLMGMPNFWIEDLSIPNAFRKNYPYISKFCSLTFCILIPFELGAFLTQDNLTMKQESDRWIYSLANPFMLMYIILTARQEHEIKRWMTHVLEMRAVYSDPKVEDQMVRKSALTSSVMVVISIVAMLLHCVSACLQVIKSEGTFTTIITVWPRVHEQSAGADAVRIITNIVWWLLMMRGLSIYTIVVSLTTCMSFQFVNLQSYFRSLDGIFQENLRQSEMEQKYEDGLKTGIKLHSDTFASFDCIKKICGGVLSGQVVLAILVLVILMSQMMRTERTMVNASATAFTATSALIGTGFFMCNAGDITVEASNLDFAIYSSGWQNCRGQRSRRVRRLVVIAMTRAQKPVVLKGLGIMDLSYESFLNLVKTSYSVFSVLY